MPDPIPFGPAGVHEQSGWSFRVVQDGEELVLQTVRRRVGPTLRILPKPVTRIDIEVSNWWIADSKAEMHAARLMTLHAAWTIDQVGAPASRDEIAMIKYYGAGVLHNVIDRGAPGRRRPSATPRTCPYEAMYRAAARRASTTGPTRLHRQTVARHALDALRSRDWWIAHTGSHCTGNAPAVPAWRSEFARSVSTTCGAVWLDLSAARARDGLAEVDAEGHDGDRGDLDAGLDVARHVLAARLVRAVDDELVDDRVGDDLVRELAVPAAHASHIGCERLAAAEPAVELGVGRRPSGTTGSCDARSKRAVSASSVGTTKSRAAMRLVRPDLVRGTGRRRSAASQLRIAPSASSPARRSIPGRSAPSRIGGRVGDRARQLEAVHLEGLEASSIFSPSSARLRKRSTSRVRA